MINASGQYIHKTYQLQYRKCGKKECPTTCREGGAGHGPYWYAFWHEREGSSRRMKSQYIGKKAPVEIEKRALSVDVIKRLGRTQLSNEAYQKVLAIIEEERNETYII